ncbi:sensor histidine kinase [Actinomadura sp. HBU206391]|uniref:sensor histidine kinase n=1 Tax=Actinomadura sp. HBU206391 TaxID=2731692 RepID=UPI001650C18D|nr:histidine kinase [Actinomadura sp. HBU206391]MBC6462749.1 sensor histidine kinase [Actinomadura sp. HBU206391]
MHTDRGIAWWPRRRSRALDIGLAVSVAVFDGVATGFSAENFFLPGPAVGAISFLLGLCLVVRRRFPVSVATLCLVLGAVAGAGMLSYLIAFYTLGAYAVSRRVVLITSGVALVAFVAQPAPALEPDEPFWIAVVVGIVLVMPSVLLGLYMGARKQLIASLQERAARLEREQHLLAEGARAEERTRIAREMHDVVANRVSVMVVQAGAVRAIAKRDPERAAEAAAVIGDMGRQALDELRQVIGVLRLGEAAAPLPAPGLGDIRGLVGQSHAAGLDVTLTVKGDERPLPAAVAGTAYRVVQEALTNVHKHAGAVSARVDLDHLPDAIEVRVENDAPSIRPDHGLPSGGNGLVGLRERVTALGGVFEASAGTEGGYAVRARVPLPAGPAMASPEA